MSKDALFNSQLWERFQEAAKKQRVDPVSLLKSYMKERLEVWEDQKLDRQVKKAVRSSGHREEDAVTIFKEHRLTRNTPRATS